MTISARIKSLHVKPILIALLILMSSAALISSSSTSNNIIGNDQQKGQQQGQSAFATFPGTNGKIVFSSDRVGPRGAQGTLFDIYTMNADGSGQQNVIFHSDRQVEPSWSPDASRIAYDSDSFNGQSDIWVMNADGSNRRQLTTNRIGTDPNLTADSDPSWSPDGSKIVFTSARSGGGTEIFIMNADGSSQLMLTNEPIGTSEPSFSPDGRFIVFASSYCPAEFHCGQELRVMNADGSNKRMLTCDGHVPGDTEPSWSPDGRLIAFTSTKGGNTDIFIMDPSLALRQTTEFCFAGQDNELGVCRYGDSGCNERRLTTSPAKDFEPKWSPDGSKIVFTSERDGNKEIYVMNADGSNQQRLTNNLAADQNPDWGSMGPLPPSARDTDRDGIFDNIDTQPTIFSNEFSDRNLSPPGRTSGVITDRGNVIFTITELSPNPTNGVQVTGILGGTPGGIRACDSGQGGNLVMQPLTRESSYPISCASSAHLGNVERGTVLATFTADDGRIANVDVPKPNGVSFYFDTATMTAFSNNADSLIVRPVVDGVEQEPISLAPGQSLVLPDTTPPDTIIDSATDGQGNPIQNQTSTSSASISFQLSSPDTDVSVFECKLDNADWEACTTGFAGYGDLAEGQHIFQGRASDQASNVDSTPAVFSWTVDFTAPETIIESATDGAGKLVENQGSTPSADITFEFSSPDTDVAVFQCSLDGADSEDCMSPKIYSALAVGSHVFQVSAKDGASNVDKTPAVWNWTVIQEPAPPITTTISHDPRNTYLHTSSNDPAPPATMLDLAASGFAPGDTLKMTYAGAWYTTGCGNDLLSEQDERFALLGVFSSSDTLGPNSDSHRVPGAIDAGSDFLTNPTFHGSEPTDIPEDFRVYPYTGFEIVVPSGATHLFFSLYDIFFSDNCQGEGGPIQITIEKTSTN